MQSNNQTTKNDPLKISGKSFSSRFLLGTGKFKNKSDVSKTILASEVEIVTVALRRIDIERHEENILEYIPKTVTLLANTSAPTGNTAAGYQAMEANTTGGYSTAGRLQKRP